MQIARFISDLSHAIVTFSKQKKLGTTESGNLSSLSTDFVAYLAAVIVGRASVRSRAANPFVGLANGNV